MEMKKTEDEKAKLLPFLKWYFKNILIIIFL